MGSLIGISSWRNEANEVVHLPHHGTNASYVRAVERAGALPVVIPQVELSAIDALLDRLDGVVLVGGADVDPSHYGQVPGPETAPAPPERDAFDLALARRCVERDHPLLAICRGVQVLNVALGGTLVQHITGHMVLERAGDTVHDVVLEPGSRCAAVMGAERVGTNSLHHQCIDQPGHGVKVTGRALDGTIEAIEIDGAPRVLGVQWHPELLRHRGDHLALFSALAEVVTLR